MIKLEHVVLASPEQMEFIIEGMRNPMNSWNKTDSFNGCETYKGISKCLDCDGIRECGAVNKYLIVGENDHSLMQRLSNAGTDHRKFMRMLPVYVRITAPLYWWNMIQLLPSSYNQTRNVMMNYEVLANIYKSRRGHKLDEWRSFCKWIEQLPYSELITGGKR